MVTPAPVAYLPSRADVLAALADVPDPEIPAVSIVELGMVGEVEVGAEGIRVELLPTFVGCPALEVIRDTVTGRLEELGAAVTVDVSFATPWTSDRITPSGRQKLRASGFAPPPPAHVRAGRALPMVDPVRMPMPGSAAVETVECPYCGSTNTTLENVFGPTQCRSIRHCADCRQPFEAFKAI